MEQRVKRDLNVLRYLLEKPIFAMFGIYIIVSLIFIPGFSNEENLINVVVQSADLIIIACGMTFVIMNGGIDFSTVAVINLGSILGASIMSHDGGLLADSPVGWLVAILAMLLIGFIIGVINGLAVVKLRMPSFISTMGTQLVFSGFALFYSQSTTIAELPKEFISIAEGSIAYIPIPIIMTVIVAGIGYYLLHHTVFGRHVFAIGTNHKVSNISGVPVKRTIFILFLLSGLFAATGGIVMTSRVGAGMPALASAMLLDIVAAVIIGGTSIAGGEGNMMGTMVGAIFIIVLNNSLNLLGLDWYVINMCKGALVLVVAFLDVIRRGSIHIFVKGAIKNGRSLAANK